MARHNLFEQTYLASIDNNHMATLIALFCRRIIPFRLKSIDKKTLYSRCREAKESSQKEG